MLRYLVRSAALLQANVAPATGFAPMRLRGGGMKTQRTYAMIKPDAVKAGKVDEMQKLIKEAGFKIIKQKKMKLSEEKVKNVTHSAAHHGCRGACMLIV